MEWKKLLCTERPGDKSAKPISENARSIFEQDFDRIVFSHPFRCLQDKTQVFPLAKTDFVHTRLTHSLEVSSVGRSLGKKVGQVIIDRSGKLRKDGFSEFEIGAIVAAAALAHDIGNPPFGHSGEDAISDYFLNDPFGSSFKSRLSEKEWADLSNYEGNAQGFRLLCGSNFPGLRITFATLAAFSKYPRESMLTKKDPERRSQKKFGFFQSEKEAFKLTALKTGMLRVESKDLCWNRHPLAFLVEAADDICYSIIDLEDGCNLGLVSLQETRDLMAPILGKKFDRKKFDGISSHREKISLLRAMVIAELIDQASQAFLDNEADILTGKFDMSLTSMIPSRKYLDEIIKISVEHIYRSTPVLEKEAAGFEVLSGLIQAFLSAMYDYYSTSGNPGRKSRTIINLFPSELKQNMTDNRNDLYLHILSCLDYVTLMTDSMALDTYRKIKGIALPGT